MENSTQVESIELCTKKDSYIVYSSDVPCKEEYRKCTDIFFLILLLATFFTFVLSVGIASSEFNLNVLKRQDNCGNICGIKNKYINNIECTGKDYTNKPILFFNITTANDRRPISKCVDSCDKKTSKFCEEYMFCVNLDNHTVLAGFCNHYGFSHLTTTLARSVGDVKWWAFFMTPIIIGITWMVVVYLFLKNPETFIYSSVTISLFALLLTMIICFTSDVQLNYGFGIVSIIVITIIFSIVYSCQKYLKLASTLLQISANFYLKVPYIFVVQGIGYFGACFVVIYGFTLCAFSLTWTRLKESSEVSGIYFYKTSFGGWILFLFILFMVYWLLFFIIGVTDLTTAGAVGLWYFSPNYEDVKYNTVLKSVFYTFRFYMGSASYGALMVVMSELMKISLYTLKIICKPYSSENYCKNYEEFLETLTTSAYPIIALHGGSFSSSGRRAMKLLSGNAANSYSILRIVYLVFVITGILLCILPTIFFSWVMEDTNIVIRLSGTFLILCFSVVYSFICIKLFCEVYISLFLCYLEAEAGGTSNISIKYKDMFEIMWKERKQIQ